MLLHMYTKEYVSFGLFDHSAPTKKQSTSEHFQRTYSWIIFPWVYLIVMLRQTIDDGFHSKMKVEKLTYFKHSLKLTSSAV